MDQIYIGAVPEFQFGFIVNTIIVVVAEVVLNLNVEVQLDELGFDLKAVFALRVFDDGGEHAGILIIHIHNI